MVGRVLWWPLRGLEVGATWGPGKGSLSVVGWQGGSLGPHPVLSEGWALQDQRTLQLPSGRGEAESK